MRHDAVCEVPSAAASCPAVSGPGCCRCHHLRGSDHRSRWGSCWHRSPACSSWLNAPICEACWRLHQPYRRRSAARCCSPPTGRWACCWCLETPNLHHCLAGQPCPRSRSRRRRCSMHYLVSQGWSSEPLPRRWPGGPRKRPGRVVGGCTGSWSDLSIEVCENRQRQTLPAQQQATHVPPQSLGAPFASQQNPHCQGAKKHDTSCPRCLYSGVSDLCRCL